MPDFEKWEDSLRPEITEIGKVTPDLTYDELDARIERVEGELLGLELEEIESGTKTPDELADEARHMRKDLGDDEA